MLFALSTPNYMPFAIHLHILLFDDLMYVRPLSFMHNVFTIQKYVILLIFFLFVYPLFILIIRTRSKSCNFYLNYAVNNSRKTSITFYGVVLWNNLAISIKELNTLIKFKLKQVSIIFEMDI